MRFEDTNSLMAYLIERGFEDTELFETYEFAPAFIGLSDRGVAVYDYEVMLDVLMNTGAFTKGDAIDYVEKLPTNNDDDCYAPIIMYGIDYI